MTTKQLMQLVCNKFSLLENVCGDIKRRQARSIPTTIKTSIAKEESNLITTRNTENNREAVTYARGNSVTVTCSMMMTVTITLLLLTLLLY